MPYYAEPRAGPVGERSMPGGGERERRHVLPLRAHELLCHECVTGIAVPKRLPGIRVADGRGVECAREVHRRVWGDVPRVVGIVGELVRPVGVAEIKQPLCSEVAHSSQRRRDR